MEREIGADKAREKPGFRPRYQVVLGNAVVLEAVLHFELVTGNMRHMCDPDKAQL
jgi:hypothetical protein